MHHDHSQHDDEPRSFWGSRYAIGMLVLGGVAAYFLLTEHLAHIAGILPYLLLLACPLMHVFMHHGGHHQHRHGGRDSEADTRASAKGRPGEQP